MQAFRRGRKPGDIVFEYACKLGCEGIVSKRLGSPYRSGRSAHWVKVKNSWLNESPPDAAWSILLAKQS